MTSKQQELKPRVIPDAPPAKRPARLDVMPRFAVEEIQNVLGLTLLDIAALTKTSERTVEQWTRVDRFPRKPHLGHLAELWQLKEQVEVLFTEPEAARQ